MSQFPLQFDIGSVNPERFNFNSAEVTLHRHFYTDKNADKLMKSILNETQWRQDHLVFGGKKILIPRLQAWYGDIDSQYAYSGLRLKPLPWTEQLLSIKKKVEKLALCDFNSVLLNYYRDGNDSVSWHSDNESELGPEPVIASLSLGVTRRFEIKHRQNQPPPAKQGKTICELEHGSLLIMGSGLQKDFLHQLPKQREITEPRINLTFRKIIP